MDAFFANSHYRLNRKFLLIAGIWPYDDARNSRFRRILIHVGFTVVILSQILSLTTSDLSLTSIIEVFATLLPSVCIFISYISSYYHGKMEMMLEHMMFDWSHLNAGEEREIVDKYANLIRMCTIAAFVIFCISLLSYILPLTSMYLLDVFVPLNETRANELPIKVELFIDQQKYFLVFLILVYVISFVVTVSAFASYLLFLGYWMHACGMLEVVGYMLRHLFDNENYSYTAKDTENVMSRLIRCIFFHERTTQYIHDINSIYNLSVVIHIFLSFFLVFLAFIRVFYLENITENMKKTCIVVSYILTIFIWMYLYSSIGQILLDKSRDLVDNAYAASWYTAPYKIQKLLIIIIMKSMRYPSMEIGGIFEVSYNFFTSMTQSAMSYAMMLHSLR